MALTTYNATLSAFTSFLTAYIHTLLHHRALYPPASFVRSRFHNTPVYQSRHPLLCEWIRDAVAAVREELLAGTVAKIAVVVFWAGTDGSQESEQDQESGGKGSVKIMERYMFDVEGFPVVSKGEREAEIAWAEESDAGVAVAAQDAAAAAKGKPKPLDADVDVDLSEQFRAALIALSSRCSQLGPLPPDCSFNISMELKDEADIDPPLKHPQPWIPVQPSLQKTGRKGATVEDDDVGEAEKEKSKEGQDLGGSKVTPLRTVEAGVFRFETWIEEGKAKLEMAEKQTQSSFASSDG